MAQLPNLTSLTIPESITAITSDTFTDCPRLSSITVAPNNPIYASIDGLLYNKALTRVLLCPESAEGVVSLPDQTDAVPASALSHCANLSTLLVGQDNVVYTSINGHLYSKDATTLVACPGGIGQTLTLPKQTTTIGPDALAGITTLKSIVVLGTITTIDPTAFNDQAKQSTTIALPGGEDYETRKAVWQSAGFKNFATPANPGDTQTPDQPSNPGDKPDNPADPSKPASGFTYKLLEDYTLEASWTGELNPTSTPTIPATAQLAGLSYTVSALAPKAFAGTSLKSIDIPASITTIGDQAFANCPKLTRIVTHSNTIQVAPTALEACTNLEVWCPYNESETYPWTIGLFATNNHIKAYGLPTSQQPLTLEVGQSATLFEPNTLQAPDPSKAVYAYEATCLSVSQEGTITAKAPGTTTISTSIELAEIPLAHTTRTISVVAPTTPAPPEQPETPTPTPPNTQPITPRYPPNLATPTQASAPLYSRGGIQPRAYVPTISVTVPTAPIIAIDAAGKPKPDDPKSTVNIESTTSEPIRATSITCTEQSGATQLLPNLNTVDPESPKGRANTKVIVTDKGTPSTRLPSFALSAAGTTWPEPAGSSALFRIEAGSTTTPATRPIAFGLTIPDNATYSYQPGGVDFASVAFTFGRLNPVATSLDLSRKEIVAAPLVGEHLTASPTDLAADATATYTWFALATPGTTPTSENKIDGATSKSFQLTTKEIGKYVCCAVSDGAFITPADWKYSLVYSEVTAKVLLQPAIKASLNDYYWHELSAIADDLSAYATSDPATTGRGSTYYTTFEKFMNYNPDGILVTDKLRASEIGMKKQLSPNPYTDQSLPEVRIVGINHDEKSDGTGNPAGLTFMATHSLPNAYCMNPLKDSLNTNEGGWWDSELRKRMQPYDANKNNVSGISGTIWDTLPTDLKVDGIIKSVDKKTNNVGSGTGHAVTPTSDKLWLPSHSELVESMYSSWTGTGYAWLAQESSQYGLSGSQYEFFKGKVGNASGWYSILVNMDKIQSSSTSSPDGLSPGSTNWWERSCYPDAPTHFLACHANGYPVNSDGASSRLGVVLGFCL